MLETILKYIGAGDQAITVMGPVLTWILSWVGGYGVTQTFKFPLKRVLPVDWSDWLVRMFAICVTWLFLHYLGTLPNWLEPILAFAQPIGYKVIMAVVAKHWPWLEASAFGSANPSEGAQVAAALRSVNKP